jgi:large subunit ribosomal protein L18
MLKTIALQTKRKQRIRARLKKDNRDLTRLRLSVFRSNKHIYAQIIDDANSATIVSASTLDKELKAELKSGSNVTAAARVGALLAQRAVKSNLSKVYFDRGGNLFHGRVKALATAARENGLQF